jgi:hypothetical protein
MHGWEICKLYSRIHFYQSFLYFSCNSTIVACLVSRLSSKHGFRREGMVLSVLELLFVLTTSCKFVDLFIVRLDSIGRHLVFCDWFENMI